MAVRISSLQPCFGECQVWDLGLSDDFETAARFRKPRPTPYFLNFRLPADHVKIGEDYALIGAEIQVVQGPLLSELVWPQVTETTGPIKLNTEVSAIGELIELFAGGLNSWSRAAAHLPVSITMRVDNKQLATQMMQLNDEINQHMSNTESSMPVMSDVADMRTLTMMRQEEGLLASPPCQPFSGMGKGQGLDAPSAIAWDRLFRLLRVCQRRYLILENVCGLTKHPDFQEIVRAILWSGYTCVARRVSDAAALGCVARPRVMLIFWNNADWVDSVQGNPVVPLISSLGDPVPCKEAGSVWERLPSGMAKDLALTTQETALLQRRELLPVWLRNSPKHPLEIRKVSLNRPMPSVTAAYHRSMDLPAKHAEAKGLHVPLPTTLGGSLSGRYSVAWVSQPASPCPRMKEWLYPL